MEHTSQAQPPAEPVKPTAADDPGAGPVVATPAGTAQDVLREELAKWRERVPKLASALRQRAEEAETLRQEVERLRGAAEAAATRPASVPAPASPSPESVSAGIRARDELIEELQAKVTDLGERHKQARAELHAGQLTLEELRTDADGWKRKWQSVTRSLDEQASRDSARDAEIGGLTSELESLRRQRAEQEDLAAANQRALDAVAEERDSLRRRNEQLFETTEVANRQIGSLTESVAGLRSTLQELREREAARATELESLRAERDTLVERCSAAEAAVERERGEFETALSSRTEALESARRAEAAGREAQGAAQQRVSSLEQDLEAARSAAGEAERRIAALTEELHLVAVAAAASLASASGVEARLTESGRDGQRLREELGRAEARGRELESARAAQQAELARLGEVVEAAQRTTDDRQRERRELAERMRTLESRNQHLEEQLEERSALVVNLEQQSVDAGRREGALQRQRDELEEALMRAERGVKENAEHATRLDAKLERQQQLMESLEAELAEAQAGRARADKAEHEGAGQAAEVERLRVQIRKLERLVRERTEALNRMEWQREVYQGMTPLERSALASESAGDPAAEPATAEASGTPSEPESKLLVVLNQQLTDARTRNDELLERLRSLEAATTRAPGDDLTRIHGVGQKLAEQLNDLGIHRFEQIAGIEESALDDENHVLYMHRGRITRDGWIEQAVRLISH